MRKKFKCPECRLVQWQDGKACKRCGYKMPKPGEEGKKFELYLHKEQGNLGQRLALYSWLLPLAGAFLGYSTHEFFEQASFLDILLDGMALAVFGIAVVMAIYGFALGFLRYGVGGIGGPAALGLLLTVFLFQQYWNDRRSTEEPPPPVDTVHVSRDETVEVRSPTDWVPTESTDAVLMLAGTDAETALTVTSDEWYGEFQVNELGAFARTRLGAESLSTTAPPERTFVDGKPAFRVLYSYTLGGQGYRAVCTFVRTRGMIHTIVGWTTEELWLKHRLALEEMSSSLKFLRVVVPDDAPEEVPVGLPGVAVSRR